MHTRIPFNEKLKKLMYEHGESIESLADTLNVTEGEIVDWRSGRKEPSSKNLIQLARYFKCSTDYLLGISDNNYSANFSSNTYYDEEEYDEDDEEEYDEDENDDDEDDEEDNSEDTPNDEEESSPLYDFLKPFCMIFFGIIAIICFIAIIPNCS